MDPHEWEVEIVIEVSVEIEEGNVEISIAGPMTLRIASVTVGTGVREVATETETIAVGLTVTEETVGSVMVVPGDSTKEAHSVVQGAVTTTNSKERGTMAITETDYSWLQIRHTSKSLIKHT